MKTWGIGQENLRTQGKVPREPANGTRETGERDPGNWGMGPGEPIGTLGTYPGPCAVGGLAI